MITVDVLGKPCPIPVIEAKKALAKWDTVDGVLVIVDNMAAVQNLEKMAEGNGYGFSYTEKAQDFFEVAIIKDGGNQHEAGDNAGGNATDKTADKDDSVNTPREGAAAKGLTVVISRDTMGEGPEELGKILIKGFIYSLTELPVPPKYVVFLNSGARLSSEGANTVEDLNKLKEKGTEIFTCGTCMNYYGLQDKLAVGDITNMYGITVMMASVGSVINI